MPTAGGAEPPTCATCTGDERAVQVHLPGSRSPSRLGAFLVSGFIGWASIRSPQGQLHQLQLLIFCIPAAPPRAGPFSGEAKAPTPPCDSPTQATIPEPTLLLYLLMQWSSHYPWPDRPRARQPRAPGPPESLQLAGPTPSAPLPRRPSLRKPNKDRGFCSPSAQNLVLPTQPHVAGVLPSLTNLSVSPLRHLHESNVGSEQMRQ